MELIPIFPKVKDLLVVPVLCTTWLIFTERLSVYAHSWLNCVLQSHAAQILGFKFQYYQRLEVNCPVPFGLYKLTALLVQKGFIDLDSMWVIYYAFGWDYCLSFSSNFQVSLFVSFIIAILLRLVSLICYGAIFL